MATARAYLASEHLENAVENGMPALKLTDTPSQAVIANYCARFFEAKLGTDQNGIDNGIGTDEEINEVFRNSEEHC